MPTMHGKNPISSLYRRDKNNKYIKELGIACLETLPCIEDCSEVRLREVESICKRAIACLLSIQLACDITGDSNYEESQALFSHLLHKYEVEKDVLPIEAKLFANKHNTQDAINVSWTYECYWALVWALGLIDTIEFKTPYAICDCEKAVNLVADCQTFSDFVQKTKIRPIEEILDMLDLYYRFHWACVEKNINPAIHIGKLAPSVVVERRRGLEWLVSDLTDWNDISLDT